MPTDVPAGPIDTGAERPDDGPRVSAQVQVATPPSFEASLDPDKSLKAIASRTAMVRKCYAAALAKAPQLAGSIDVQLDVARDGVVVAAVVRGVDAELDACIEEVYDKLRLPAPSDGEDAEAKFRLTLAPG